MRYLNTYKLFERKIYFQRNNMDNFLDALTKELKPIGFDLEIVYDTDKAPDYKDSIDISKDGETYLNYYMYDFSIDKLKEDCINNLEDKSDWVCDDTAKDDYDTLCTSILVFIDEWKNK